MFRGALMLSRILRPRFGRTGRNGRSAAVVSSFRAGWLRTPSLWTAALGSSLAGAFLIGSDAFADPTGGIIHADAVEAPAEAAPPAWAKIRKPKGEAEDTSIKEEWREWDDEKPQGGKSGIQQTAAEVVTPLGPTPVSPGAPAPSAVPAPSGSAAPESVELLGLMGRGGHLAGETFGRNESISPLEFLPYWMVDDHFFFADLRGFITNRSQGGGNLGLGYRFLDESAGAWYGASLWYDIDNSTGYHFQDVGVSLEAMVRQFEFRGNYYTPIGKQQSTLAAINTNARFVGNQLLFDSFSRTGTAMQGFDLEAGYALPVDLGGVNDQLRAYAGYYRFTGDNVEDINGVKVRAELDMSSTVTTNVMFTHDKTFGSRVMAGVQLSFPWGNSSPASHWRRDMPNPFRFVERNYNVIVSQTERTENDIVARDANGNAYVVAHVDSGAAAGGTGGQANPYQSIAAALAGTPGATLFFVHRDSVLNEQITLNGGKSLIGEGSAAVISVAGYGNLAMPVFNTGAAPILDGTGLGAGANAITLSGAGNYVSGFGIRNFGGAGIVGNGINGATLRNLTFNNIGGDGIALTGATGTVNLENLTLDTIGGRGLFINGGSANVNVNASFDQVTGDSILVQNTTGGAVRLTDVDITAGGGRGLSLINLLGDFFSSDLNINGVGGDGIYINQGTGTMNFAGQTVVNNPGGRGFVINASAADVTVENLDVKSAGGTSVELNQATGEVTIETVAIDADAARGLVITDSTGVAVNGGTIKSVGYAGVDIDSSNVDVGLTSVSVDGGSVGIRILDSTGTFYVRGDVSGTEQNGSGGTIKNTAQAVLINSFGNIALQRMNFTSNVLGISTRGTDSTTLSYSKVTGTTGGYGFDSLNDKSLMIANSTFSGNGVVGGGTIRVRADVAGAYESTIVNNTITDTVGTAIAYSNSGAGLGAWASMTIQGNEINASRAGEEAVDIRWSGPLTVYFAANEMNLTGNSMIGLNLHQLSTTSTLKATVGGNTVDMNGDDSIAFKTEAEDTSNLLFAGNHVTMDGERGQAFWFDLADTGTAWIHSNDVTDNGGDGIGINFAHAAARSILKIENNEFSFEGGGTTYGIRIEDVTWRIELGGTYSNTITGATNNFVMPAGKGTGSLIINDVAVPAP